MDIPRRKVIDSLKTSITEELATHLVDEYIKIKRAFSLGHYAPAELSGGRFGEVIVRIFEYLRSGIYTPLGSSLSNTSSKIDAFENDGTQDEFFRFFIPKVCRIIMGVRNKRNVAHLSSALNPNFPDSLLVMESATWAFSEIIRLFSSLSIDEASKLISSISYQRVPIIEDIGGFPKILDTKLATRDKILLLLYAKFPDWVADADLKNWVDYANITQFRRNYLEPLSTSAFTHRQGQKSILTQKGVQYVEANIKLVP